MKIGEVIKIYTEQATSMSGCWTDRIYLARLDDERYELSNCGPEGLQIASDFMDEDGNYDLPDQINGVDVVGVEGDYVMSDHYIADDRFGTVQFSSLKDPVIQEWFENSENCVSYWYTDQILDAIRKHMGLSQ